MQDWKRVTRQIACAAAFGLNVLLSGCTSYYVITDPTTGKTYYTTDCTRSHGATRFVDAKSGARVTIQSSEIREITQSEFQQNTGKQ